MASDPPSSRIFVKNLPPSLTDDDFRKHFSNDREITDVKFFKNRRIGYVGYKSPEEAKKAVKYFNKSFIRMSRIGVELAAAITEAVPPSKKVNARRPKEYANQEPTKTPTEAKPLKRKRDEGKVELAAAITEAVPPSKKVNARRPKEYANQEPTKTPTEAKPLKRKRDEGKVENDAKLNEFLGVMQATAKSKTWQNEIMDGVENNPALSKPEEDSSDDDLQIIGEKSSKKSRLSKSELPEESEEFDNSHVSSEQERAAVNTSKSDADWLRSKTSRVLQDSDAEEEAEHHNNTTITGQRSAETAPLLETKAQREKGVDDSGDLPDEISKIQQHGRLYVRNLPFSVTEDDLRNCFGSYGDLEEVHVPLDRNSGKIKGFAFILFRDPADAVTAYQNMDGKTFQGRLVHIIPAQPKRENKMDEFAISQLPLKQQMKMKRKMEAPSATYKWNPLYMNMNDVMSSISSRLGIEKAEMLDPTSSDAAIKQALAETHVIQETKAYFVDNGVDLDSFSPGRQRGDKAILVKNFPHGTKSEEIRELFSPHGQIVRLLIPPSGTMALVEFAQDPQGNAAFDALKYRRVKNTILFLEKAPKDVFNTAAATIVPVSIKSNGVEAKLTTSDLLQDTPASSSSETSTLFIRNLNFSTTTDLLKETFSSLAGFLSAKVKTKTDPKRPGQILSMGFGFLEFKSKGDAQAAMAAMNGHLLEGHKLDIRPSQRVLDAGEEQRKKDKAKSDASQKTKVIVKNLPFEAGKKDVRALLGAYGQLRSVRVPKKSDSTARGFAFAEFTTAREAANAMSALKSTHLLGRRLHLEYAEQNTVDPEEEIEKMQKKVGSQFDKVTLQKMTGAGRKKFNVAGNDSED